VEEEVLTEAVIDETGIIDEIEREEEEEKTTVIDDLFPLPTKKKKMKNLSQQEIMYWKKLIGKYKDDYKAMARDIKLNNYQHTPKQCKKKSEIYLKKYSHVKKLKYYAKDL